MHRWLAHAHSLGTIRTLVVDSDIQGEGEVTLHDFVPDPTRLERLWLKCAPSSSPVSVDLSRYTRLTHLSVDLDPDWGPELAPLFALPALRVLFIGYRDGALLWEPLAQALLDFIAWKYAPAEEHTNGARYRTVHLTLDPGAMTDDRPLPEAVERFQSKCTGRTLGRGVLCVHTWPEQWLYDSVF